MQSRLPALDMFASLHSLIMSLILSKVKIFSWMYFGADCSLKICIGYFSILVPVKSSINFVKSLIRDLKTPVIKVKLKFFGLYMTRFVFLKVLKRFLDCLPLLLDLFNNHLSHIILRYNLISQSIFVLTNIGVILNEVLFVSRIHNRIMSEVKALNRVNCISNPS